MVSPLDLGDREVWVLGSRLREVGLEKTGSGSGRIKFEERPYLKSIGIKAELPRKMKASLRFSADPG